ncbi:MULTISPECIES: ABC transporter permease [Paenibacillus]|jgi:peptide/nickel transport system permease protein|uniref:Peptide ABC transporter permease n=4 Tax=Paenibacillus TaxID=44249 RepID=A0ABX2ZJT9_PAEPO|nr:MULTISPECIES: ABC transporter permease [Paenibacillus]ALA41074.1 peptide ABC transporter permease [Paenibacillus peoriae]MBP1175064.1 peptide/nickel transport system permease protein [Paenibacillus sp. PvR133]MCP3744284.1 ABC transporter permease [Paenibacillus sp. A3M_27_13]MDR6777531.1 peptide/nickel transport system permease protein [Paenibacillus peoriae]ODA10621.1 peptide ABC transporter permease [Paenibacillus polymyxa]
MNSYIVKRLAILIPVLLGMTLIVFSIIHAIPGDPAETILGDKATEQSKQALREQLGLDKPWLQQYGTYLGELAQGDLGDSIRTRQPIAREMLPYLAATLELTVASMFFAVVVGMNAGIVSAWKRNSWFDYVSMVIALVGVSMPIFWLGLMEQWIFANKLHWLPSIGRMNSRDPVEAVTHLAVIDAFIGGRMDQVWTVIKHLILPSIALGTIPMAVIARITRSSMLEVMDADYIRTARAKGLASFQVVYKHALKNAAIPVLTVIGLQTGSLLGGAVLTETIFAWPGIGRYIFEAISSRDYPVIQSGILIIAFLFVIINLIVDLLYAVLDRRIRYQ